MRVYEEVSKSSRQKENEKYFLEQFQLSVETDPGLLRLVIGLGISVKTKGLKTYILTYLRL